MTGAAQNIPEHKTKAKITAGILSFFILFFLSELDSGFVIPILSWITRIRS